MFAAEFPSACGWANSLGIGAPGRARTCDRCAGAGDNVGRRWSQAAVPHAIRIRRHVEQRRKLLLREVEGTAKDPQFVHGHTMPLGRPTRKAIPAVIRCLNAEATDDLRECGAKSRD